MLEVYFTENENVYGKLKKYLSGLLNFPFEISKTENGKPFIEGDPLFFSLSHSRDKAVIVICDKPVGVDLEAITGRNYRAVLSRFTEKERAEIAGAEDFLKHWTAREAYIKMLGSTLAEKLYKLEFTNGALYENGKITDCEIISGCKEGCVYTICKKK